MSVGNMGSEFRMAYTVLGDAANLGARLEGLTKIYGAEIIVSESTANMIPGYKFCELDQVRVKGKYEPITIFSPVVKVENLTHQHKQMLALQEQALHSYRQQNWEQSMAMFNQLAENSDEQIYQIFLKRIEHFLKMPPPENWDGIFSFEIK